MSNDELDQPQALEDEEELMSNPLMSDLSLNAPASNSQTQHKSLFDCKNYFNCVAGWLTKISL